MWLGSSWQCKSVHRALPDHGCRRYRSFLPFRRNSLLEALSRLRRGPAFPFPASLWLKWPFTWRSNVVCNRRHQSAHIATHSLMHKAAHFHIQPPKVSNCQHPPPCKTIQHEQFKHMSKWWRLYWHPTLQGNLQGFTVYCCEVWWPMSGHIQIHHHDWFSCIQSQPCCLKLHRTSQSSQ